MTAIELGGFGRRYHASPPTLAPQFRPGSWNAYPFVLVAVIAGCAYVLSYGIGWDCSQMLAGLAGVDQLPDSTANAIATVVCAGVTVGTILVMCRLLPATALSFGFVKPRLAQLGLAAVVWLVSLVAMLIALFEVERLTGPIGRTSADYMDNHHGLIDYWNDVVTSAVATPIVEEALFRGLFFAALVQRMPAWLAALISSFVFAVCHFEPHRIIPLTIMGVGFAYIYYRSGTLWAPIAAHALNNLLVVSLTLWLNG
ncbi:MAG: CPBP family intramembrane metalloprotease [Candidatus Eremiobacteraeota bacterium]|nr:CPBP family intramembrane metalloprotease [Candidatus Eremiobacteraeota bacterium]